MLKYFSQKREIKQNQNSIPSRKFILDFLKKQKKPISHKKLIKKICLQDVTKFKALNRRLYAMKRDGQLLLTYRKQYTVPKNFNLIKGKVIGHRDGYGFLRVEGQKDDFYLSTEQMKFCIHGDIILAQIIKTDRKGRKEVRVIRIQKSKNKKIIGRYIKQIGSSFVIPNDNRLPFNITIPSKYNLNANENSIVIAELLNRPTHNHKANGKITEILGEKMDVNLAINIALRSHEIPYNWSNEAKLQINNFSHKLTETDKIGRIDLRKLPLITIDDETARDFDDALYCEKMYSGGWRLWVAIADVSYYVRPGTPLDKEAYLRGNSVYFPSQVIPMLPEILSNDLCSLNPKVDCLCIVCEMNISSKGKLTSFKHYEAIMNSHARLTYNEAWNILQGDNQLHNQYKLLKNILSDLHYLYKVLEQDRHKRGGIYFENSDVKFIFNTENSIKNIKRVFRNDIHKIVEECMILANFASARFVEKSKVPILFRDHDRPTNDSIKNFYIVLNELGISLKKREEEKPTSIEYSLLLKKIANRPDSEMLQMMLLRSMKQAIYDPKNRGHFGLALNVYTHFTSPIRRYPDLLLHRVIKYLLYKEKRDNLFKDNGGYKYNIKEMIKLGYQCSLTERRAEEAVRDVSDWLKCDFMRNRIGKIFEGVIFSITNFGLFVRLNEFFIEGLIHISTLTKDHYTLDTICQRLTGKSSGCVYSLGDTVKVSITAVNMDARKIDLTLISYCSVFSETRNIKRKNMV
ncbi:ribonuclease R [Candidatus Pantoea edessiphila]|uniref:Ribonuclease R n=1 Tax=Candidatus Pantoea edessiphila TaxID=2044610 RepID=A0A2P5SVU3_9GAMM|nr:ribonuclease R [Candidatus Pantoea edessiphila]PPI86443.1 ribonuclease R [Candidatus Pantoea edessiphila]